MGKVLSVEAGRCCLELKTWHPLQLLTISLASSKAVGQKKPWRKALATSDLEAVWWPHSPWWISLRIATPFSGSTQHWKTPVTLRLTSSLFIIAYAPARCCTNLAEISSVGSSLLTRKLRMGWAHDGAVTSSTVSTTTVTRGGWVVESWSWPPLLVSLQSPGRLLQSPGRVLKSPSRVRLRQSPGRLSKSSSCLLGPSSRIQLHQGWAGQR